MEKSQEKDKKEWKSGDLREEKKKCSSISNLCGNDRAFPVVAFSEGAPVYSTMGLMIIQLLQTPEPHLLGVLVQ